MFLLGKIDLFSCSDEMIYLVLYFFEVYFDYLVVFAVSVSLARTAPFFE